MVPVDRGIIFDEHSITSILADQKWNTQRVIKPQWPHDGRVEPKEHSAQPGLWIVYTPDSKLRDLDRRCIFGTAGTRLYVKETWGYAPGPDKDPATCPILHYQASPEAEPVNGWRQSMFMPRRAARIWLRVTAITAAPIQEISDSDLLAEGILFDYVGDDQKQLRRAAFQARWDLLNAGRGHGWDTNPWCFKIAFERMIP